MEFFKGSLGFLVTGTDKNQLHGNYGILDQKMAVKWYFKIHQK